MLVFTGQNLALLHAINNQGAYVLACGLLFWANGSIDDLAGLCAIRVLGLGVST